MANIGSNSRSSWIIITSICLGLFTLGIIAGVIVLSLISLYLPSKGADLTRGNTESRINQVDMVFATNMRDINDHSITNVQSLGTQLNDRLNSRLFKLDVQKGSFAPTTASTRRSLDARNKRQTTGTISCAGVSNGKRQTSTIGDKMVIASQLDKSQTTMCPFGFCNDKQLSVIKSKIQSTFGSAPFPLVVTLDDGTTMTMNVLFCSFSSLSTCGDGVKNQDETDVDCGGSCSNVKTCANGLGCVNAVDCQSNVCVNNVCQNQNQVVSNQTTTITTTTKSAEKIVWNQCNDSLLQEVGAECGFVSVPLDHNEPTGEQIQIAVSRLKHNVSADKYQGVILLNPGGPGADGLYLPYLATFFDPSVSNTYDWIGFDPRGVGASIPMVSCAFNSSDVLIDYVPINDVIEDYYYNLFKIYAEDCAQKYPKLLHHTTTVDIAKDMDMIRVALNQDQINFYGFSYGTYLGQVYATLFPNRVRRMILDGNVDPQTVWFSFFISQNVGLDRNLKLWFNWLAQYDSVFKLGTTECEVTQKFENVRKELEINPINGTIGPAEWEDLFTAVTYTRNNWISYGRMFSAWVIEKSFSALLEKYQESISASTENSYAIFSAVVCSEAPWPKDWKYVRREYWRSYALLPYLTWSNNWYSGPCQEWGVTGTTLFNVNGTNIGDILLVNSMLDAATPVEGSYTVRRLFPNARLITIINETIHCDSFRNSCSKNIITEYLKSGKLEARKPGNVVDYECEARPVPDPSITARRLTKVDMFDEFSRKHIRRF